jgi:hypothetical protein
VKVFVVAHEVPHEGFMEPERAFTSMDEAKTYLAGLKFDKYKFPYVFEMDTEGGEPIAHEMWE